MKIHDFKTFLKIKIFCFGDRKLTMKYFLSLCRTGTTGDKILDKVVLNDK